MMDQFGFLRRSVFAFVAMASLVAGCARDSQPAAPQPEAEAIAPSAPIGLNAACGQVDPDSPESSKRPLQYCYEDRVRQAVRSATVPIFYFFHGLGGNVGDPFNGDARFILDAMVRVYGGDMPVVVSLSLGSDGILAADSEWVASEGLAQVEAIVARGKPARRVVMGGSMGGYNTLRLVAQAPRKFVAAAALCPALATFNGHRQAEVDAYMERHRAILDRDFFLRALESYKRQLSTEAVWEANSPFAFLASGAFDALPIFMSVGREDQLGFIEGAREFRSRAQARGVNLDYHEVSGPHCVFDLLRFLQFIRAND